ncbi:MAG TPA: hypothetical protein VMV49_10805 [Candidatus Deferrimicrobium sp.]|nr:hypothetical protein [Candidatus Deferrimicrobium sp.]
MKRITIYDIRTESSHSTLEACIDDQGDLVLEGYDIGDFVKEYWGDSDYEYWLRVKAEHVPAVLLWLIQERFKTDSEFRNWLDAKKIPSQFDNYI